MTSDAEDVFRVMADTAPVMIWVSDADKKCTWLNSEWLRFTGRTLEEEIGDGWASAVHPEDIRHTADIYVAAFEARKSFTMEFRLRRHDGNYRWLLGNGVPHIDPDGSFKGYIGTSVDIHDQREAQAMLKRMVADQQTLLRDKDALMKEIHHRVKNNFQLIISMFRLRSRRANPEERARLDEIARSIGVMAAIQEELLHHPNASRIEFGTYLRTLVEGYRTLADGRIEVDDSGIGQVDIPVGNAVPLALAANEALSNAFNHAFPGGRRGRLRMSLGEDPRDGFVLIIEDDGVGFDPGRPPSGGMGMEIMRALAGQASAGLDVVSETGTRVVIRGREAA